VVLALVQVSQGALVLVLRAPVVVLRARVLVLQAARAPLLRA